MDKLDMYVAHIVRSKWIQEQMEQTDRHTNETYYQYVFLNINI